jgi:hypothetical protein
MRRLMRLIVAGAGLGIIIAIAAILAISSGK